MEKLQGQITNLKESVSVLEYTSTASDFHDDLMGVLREVSKIIEELQPQIIDPADLSKNAEQTVLNAIAKLEGRVVSIEENMLTEYDVKDIAERTDTDTDFEVEADISVYSR